jgi:disulfide bond formation protein DsbB
MLKNYSLLKLVVFSVSAIATFGSLYFSEVMKLPPCSLCWYQRIFMYPIVLISLINILTDSFKSIQHEFVFSAGGLMIAIYHNLLYYGFIENIVPCAQGVSCTSRLIEWFGFVTIPLLSLLGFLVIFAVSIYTYYLKRKSYETN